MKNTKFIATFYWCVFFSMLIKHLNAEFHNSFKYIFFCQVYFYITRDFCKFNWHDSKLITYPYEGENSVLVLFDKKLIKYFNKDEFSVHLKIFVIVDMSAYSLGEVSLGWWKPIFYQKKWINFQVERGKIESQKAEPYLKIEI